MSAPTPAARELGHLFDRAEESFALATQSAAKTGHVIARADAIMERAKRPATARAAGARERKRLNCSLGRTLATLLTIFIAVWLVTIVVGLIQPIGLFGLVGAVIVALVAATMYLASLSIPKTIKAPSADLPPAALVDRLDSYLYRARPALPAPAQFEVDRMLERLPGLKPGLEHAPALDPVADDAKRLMGTHLPGLIDRYLKVPSDFRGEIDGGGKTVDERLVEALKASGKALDETAEQLARGDLQAFETQGRFIEQRYGDKDI